MRERPVVRRQENVLHGRSPRDIWQGSELATDPDCAGGLERTTYSMDDFVRRVFMDSLTGS